jgi:Holliday junction resolvase RusA-like endonuclease|tara:strand:+ start:2567 stop:2980 length:414 start_codon:yes stop_codon:yes gene_type:complete
MLVTLDIQIKPQAHQSFRFARNGRRYKPKKITDYQNNLRNLVSKQLPNNFEIIQAGSKIKVNYIEYIFSYPKSFSKKKKLEFTYKTTKPDLQDNLNKAFFDALEGLIYEQDQNIVVINKMSKFYGEQDRIRVEFKVM